MSDLLPVKSDARRAQKDPKLPLFNLRPTATPDDLRETINALLEHSRPFERMQFEGGRVFRSKGNVLLSTKGAEGTGGTGDTGGAGTGGSGTPGAGTGGVSPEPANAEDAADYGDFAEAFTLGDASTPGATVDYEYSTRGGTAALIGFSEFSAASSPPKKYLRQDQAGTQYQCGPCTGPLTVVSTYPFSSTWLYDANTGALSGPTSYTYYVNKSPSSCAAGGGTPTVVTGYGPYNGTSQPSSQVVGGQNITNGPTTRTQSGSSICDAGVKSYGALITTLSDEDTEENAIARLIAGGGGTWGSWLTCALPCGAASWVARTTGFTFAYAEAQLKITFNDLPEEWLFLAKVRITRLRVSDGLFEEVEERTYEATTDIFGDAEITVTIKPEEAGWSYRVEEVTYAR